MDVTDLIEAQDMNGLLRAIDSLCERSDWDGLIDLAERCEAALERGKQLWPIAEHVDYRLALEAPGEIASGALHPGVGRFSPGPLTEVVASTHRWEEVAGHIDDPGLAAYVAQERILRGEDLTRDDRAFFDVLGLPPRLLGWEPAYRLATYHSAHVEIQEPWEPSRQMAPAAGDPATELDEPEMVQALVDLVAPWTNESGGAARAVVVEGDALGAVTAIAPADIRIGPLEVEIALQTIAWAAASGGAYGRRRGAALGRSMLFFVAGLLADDPAIPHSDLGEEMARLSWYRWDEGTEEEGWVLRLAVEDPDAGWAAAIAATDLADDDDGDDGDGDDGGDRT